mgnify:FL=1
MNKKLSEAKQRLFQQMISADHVELNEHVDDFIEDIIGIFVEDLKEKNNPLLNSNIAFIAEKMNIYFEGVRDEFLKKV